MKSIGRAIYKVRKIRGMIQEDVAKFCDMDESQISRIESGHRDVKWKELLQIAQVLNVDVLTIVLLAHGDDKRITPYLTAIYTAIFEGGQSEDAAAIAIAHILRAKGTNQLPLPHSPQL